MAEVSYTLTTTVEGGNPTKVTGLMRDGMFVAEKIGNENYVFKGVSLGASVFERMAGVDQENIRDLLTRAINNRTRQRNYFRLYSEMLEGTVDEDDFYRILEENEDEYVIAETEAPTIDRIKAALLLSKDIMDVKSSEDISNLFSFDTEETDKCLNLIESHGSLQ